MYKASDAMVTGVLLRTDQGSRIAMANQAIQISVIRDFAALSAEELSAWNAILAAQPVPVPFQTLFWNDTWWKHFGGSSRLETKRLLLFVLRSGEDIVGFFPMFRQVVAFAGVDLIRFLKPLGGDKNLTELRTGIVKPGYERSAYAALLDYFLRTDRAWDVISLPAGPTEIGDLYDNISIAHPKLPLIEGFALELSADWETFRGTLKRNIKESIRKCQNSFKRDGIELDFACLSDAAAIRETLPEFFRLHTMRASQKDGNYHRDVFEAAYARQFLDLLVNDAEKSGIRLFVLKHGERLVAARLGFQTERGTYLYYSGYDSDYGKYSVMTRLVVDAIRDAIVRGQTSMHFSFGRDVSKTRWGPQELLYQWRLMFQKSLRGSLASVVFLSLMRLKRR